ncbi:MAG TPA: MarP family serine protease [Streptosporangiaceae bacterium]|nr:MarP family serine protease [Streptosporangiaceae bacterium]
MPGDLLDLILIVLAAAFAVAGYRQGFIIGILSFAGFIGGVAVGAIVAPRISQAMATSLPWQAFIAILVVFSAAVVGMVIASGIGVAVRSRLRGRPVTVLDSLGGAAVNVVAVLLVAWLIGSFVAYSPFPQISGQVNDSAVLKAVDGVVPRSALTLPGFPPLRRLLTSGPYTQVFSALGAESALAIPAPDRAVLNSTGLAKSRNSIVKIMGVAPSCSKRIEGTGFVVSPHHVLTNAHVVAGVTDGPNVYTRRGKQFRATVVLYDPQRDVAVLNVPGLAAHPLTFAGPAPFGASAIVAGYPLNRPFTVGAARLDSAESAIGPNIYQNAQVRRQIYPIRALVRPGNSGGPLLAPDGSVYGVVFAAAVSLKNTGYALTASEVSSDVARGERATSPVSTQACQS